MEAKFGENIVLYSGIFFQTPNTCIQNNRICWWFPGKSAHAELDKLLIMNRGKDSVLMIYANQGPSKF